MQNVLVTGGAGFIGSNFVYTLLASDPGVHIIDLDALTYAGSLENLTDLPDPARHTFIRGDICDRPLLDDLFRRYRIDTVVHFAAETHVDRSILGPGQFVQTNVVGTFTLLEAARHAWLDEHLLPDNQVRFHHVSTDEVFGSLAPADPAFSETTPYAPNSPYAASKAASDHLVRAYFHTYGLPVTITNCSNNYGPRQFPEKLIPLFILNGVQGKPLPVYGDGQQVRDWLYVEDHCEAIRLVIEHGQPGQTYNVGGNNQPSNLEIIHTLCEILDEVNPAAPGQTHAGQIRYVTDRPGHDRRYAMDIRKIEQDLGWRPRQSLHDGLLKTVTWYLDHPQWVSSVLKSGDFTAWMDRNYARRSAGGNK